MVVLGHVDYYPRFGFLPASTFGVRCQYDVSPEAFMAVEITADALDDAKGIAFYQAEFGPATTG